MNKKQSKCKGNMSIDLAGDKTLVADVLSLARQQGASACEVALSRDKGLTVSTRLGEVETVEFNQDKGIGVTVYLGFRRGSASSSDTSSEAIQQVVKRAIDIAKVSDEDSCYGLADAKLMAYDYPELELYHEWDIDAPKAIDIAKSCEGVALNSDERIVNSEGCSVSSYRFNRVYANSHGFVGDYATTRHSKSCVLLGKDKKGLQRDYDYTASRRPESLLDDEALAKSAVSKTLKRLDARKISTRQSSVIFSRDVSSSLLGIFTSAISGGNIYRKSSFLLDKLGEALLPSRYNIFEEPHIKMALGSAPYDGDGVMTRNNVFLRDGCLESYVLGSYSARRLGLETTANAGGVHNLTITHDDLSFDDLVKKMDKGLVVTELMGQGVNIVTGDYSRGASGFWVENGIIQYPVEEITIAARLQDMFKNIVAIGNDIDERKATRCGSIMLEEMTVAGQ